MKLALNILNLFFGLLLLSGFAGCFKEQLKPADLVKWVENDENGLKKTKTVGEIDYTVQYKPVAYVIANEEKTNDLSTTTYKQRKQSLEGMHYFTLRFSKSNKQGDLLMYGLSDQQQYQQRVTFMSFDMKNDIYVLEGEDTLKCKLYNFVRNYGIAPYTDVVMAFERNEKPDEAVKKDQQLVFNDRVFGNGKIQFTIDKDDINNTPEIITQNEESKTNQQAKKE